MLCYVAFLFFVVLFFHLHVKYSRYFFKALKVHFVYSAVALAISDFLSDTRFLL